MDFEVYDKIDEKLLDVNYQNMFTLCADNIHKGQFHSTLWNFRERQKGAHQSHWGNGYRLKGALEQSQNQEEYRNYSGGHDYKMKFSKLTSLEKLLRTEKFKVVSQRKDEEIFTYISKEDMWNPENHIVGILKPTFSEGIYLLNQFVFNPKDLAKIHYADSVQKAIQKIII